VNSGGDNEYEKDRNHALTHKNTMSTKKGNEWQVSVNTVR